MVTTEINDHKSEMNNEIKVLSVAITDQIKDVVHNPKWHQKLISKRVQQHWKLNKMLSTHVEVKIATNNKLQKQNKNVNSAGNG